VAQMDTKIANAERPALLCITGLKLKGQTAWRTNSLENCRLPLWNPKLIQITLKIHSIYQRKQNVSPLQRVTGNSVSGNIVVYSENHKKPINRLHSVDKIMNYWMLQEVVQIVTTVV
jgi:hypothetical protein